MPTLGPNFDMGSNLSPARPYTTLIYNVDYRIRYDTTSPLLDCLQRN